MELPTLFQTYIHRSRYARWRDDLGRRETWDETVQRYFDFFVPHIAESCGFEIDPKLVKQLKKRIVGLEVMPSMRALMAAGPALKRDGITGYNCSFRAIDDTRSFDEILFILMCGTGVGFSVERQYIAQLPIVPEVMTESNTMVVVRDSKIGWAEALREFIGMLYAGRVPKWDVSKVRPAGARLKTMGGRASGPEPLVDLFKFLIQVFDGARGRRLTSIECHDIVCRIGDCVVVGGVRRSALISLSNLSDQRMRDAKSGNWHELYPHRSFANNSVAYTERPEVGQWMREWLALYDSKSGERGIFNREAVTTKAASIGRKVFWDEAEKNPIEFGGNPCLEIVLRSGGLCNLTEVVARPGDSESVLMGKVEAAAILGTWQATLTRFRYLSRKWQSNAEEEALLGVSITGIMDCPLLNGLQGRVETGALLRRLRGHARAVNRAWAKMLDINPAAAVTCVKPSGTVSSLTLSGAGIHAWHAPTYIRRVRQDIKDPLAKFLIEAGVPHESDHTKPEHQVVFSFPMRAPDGAVIRGQRTAIEELEHWKLFHDNWCDHNPSVTISVREHEWPAVGAWVWEHFDHMSGVSFLPYSEHNYRQAPYEACDEEALAALQAQMPAAIDWSKLAEFEDDDEHVSAHRELSCVAGSCDIV